MIGNVFIDSNPRICYYSMAPDDKFTPGIQIILPHWCLVAWESFTTSKNMASEADAKPVITDLVSEFTVVAIDSNQVIKAIDMNMRYRYSYWDSLIIATALQSDCTTLYSEDMQYDQFIENKLRIVNTFFEKGSLRFLL